MKKNFIKTTDKHTAELLREAGLKELAKEGNRWVFINEPNKLDFSTDDQKNIHATNILCF